MKINDFKPHTNYSNNLLLLTYEWWYRCTYSVDPRRYNELNKKS